MEPEYSRVEVDLDNNNDNENKDENKDEDHREQQEEEDQYNKKEDDSESDDQGPMWNTPLTSKPVFKAEGEIDISESTAMTSPCSSATTNSSHEERNFSLTFDDNLYVTEVDCDYTDEQVGDLWFTKEEYDDFLQACDDDAQKCEEHEKETRVNKLKKEIKRQRKQRQKEEKRLQRVNALDESMNSMAHFEVEKDEGLDHSDDDDEPEDPALDYNEDKEGSLCSLGLEAWTLEGYKAREHHRQKAIDSVLNEQHAAWDRGMVENTEMMAALYFAASAITKHEAHKKAVQLEADVQEHTIVSTLRDYNKAIETLNVLQSSLACIQMKRKENEARNKSRPPAKRRGSTGSSIPSHTVATRRGSTGGMVNSGGQGSSSPTGVIDQALAISKPLDRAPQMPAKSSSPRPPQTSSSSSSRKKLKQRNAAQKVYKSKAATDILFSPPTPPVNKKPTVSYKPSQGGRPGGGEAPLTGKESEDESSIPKYRKVVYKPTVEGTSKHDPGSRSKEGDTETTKKKKKKKKKDSSGKTKKYNSERERHRYRSKSPRSRERRRERSRERSSERSSDRSRSKSPHSSEHGSSKHSRTKTTRSVSPRPKKNSTKESSATTGKLLKKTSPIIRTRDSVAARNGLPQRSSKKEHWWFQQQREAWQ